MRKVKTIESEMLRQTIASNFQYLSKHKKMAIVHFLELITTSILFDSNNQKTDLSGKYDYIHTVKKAFDIQDDEQSPFCYGHEICFKRVDRTLRHLSRQEKEEFVLLASGLIGCSGLPYYLEFIFCIRRFQQIGITADDFYNIVTANHKKKQAFFATN